MGPLKRRAGSQGKRGDAPATVLVAGRHDRVRGSLTTLLREMPEVGTVREADQTQTLLALCRAAACDAVVLDAALPADGEIGLLTLIQQARPSFPVIVHSFTLEKDLVERCLRVGARAFLAAEDLADEIVAAVRAVLAGGMYLSRTVRALMRDEAG